MRVVEVARVGQLQPQRADALDALVVNLARPAGALALTRLHAVAQSFDLHRALGGEALGDARGERAQRLAVRSAEAAVAAQRDHEPPALAIHPERLDQRRARLQPEFVQPRGLLASWSIEGDRLALEVQGAERAALHGRDPQSHRPGAAGCRHAQLSALLDDHQQGARVEQREPAIGHEAQKPQL